MHFHTYTLQTSHLLKVLIRVKGIFVMVCQNEDILNLAKFHLLQYTLTLKLNEKTRKQERLVEFFHNFHTVTVTSHPSCLLFIIRVSF